MKEDLKEIRDVLQKYNNLYVEDIGFNDDDPDDGHLMVCGDFQITFGMMRKARATYANPNATKEEMLEALRPFAKLPDLDPNDEYDVIAGYDGFTFTKKMYLEVKQIYNKYK